MRFQTPKDKEIWERRRRASRGMGKDRPLPRPEPSARDAIGDFRRSMAGEGGAGLKRATCAHPPSERPPAGSERPAREQGTVRAPLKRATLKAPKEPEIILAGEADGGGRLRTILRHGLIFAGIAIVIAVQGGLLIAALRDDAPDLDPSIDAALRDGGAPAEGLVVAERGDDAWALPEVDPVPPEIAPAAQGTTPAPEPDAEALADAVEPAPRPEPAPAMTPEPDPASPERLVEAAPKPDAAPAAGDGLGGPEPDAAGIEPALTVTPEPDPASPERLVEAAPKPDAAPAAGDRPAGFEQDVARVEPAPARTPEPDPVPPDRLVEAAPKPDAAPAAGDGPAGPEPDVARVEPAPARTPEPDPVPPDRLAEAAPKPHAAAGGGLQIAPQLDIAEPERATSVIEPAPDPAGAAFPDPEPPVALNEVAGQALAQLMGEAGAGFEDPPSPPASAGPIELLSFAPAVMPVEHEASGTGPGPSGSDGAPLAEDRQAPGALVDAAGLAMAQLTGGPGAAPTISPSGGVPRELSVELAASLEGPADGPVVTPAAASDARVFVHYAAAEPGADARARRLASYLQTRGFEVVDLRAVRFSISDSRIRYFFEGDLEEASALRDGLSQFFGNGGGAVEIEDFTHFRPKPTQGNIEVWIPST